MNDILVQSLEYKPHGPPEIPRRIKHSVRYGFLDGCSGRTALGNMTLIA